MYVTAENRRKYEKAPVLGVSPDCAWGGTVVLAVNDYDGVVFWCKEYDGRRHELKCSRLSECEDGRAYFTIGRGRGCRLYLDEIERVG